MSKYMHVHIHLTKEEAYKLEKQLDTVLSCIEPSLHEVDFLFELKARLIELEID